MFPTLIRRLAQSSKEPLAKQTPFLSAGTGNAHKARKVWPPSFKHLSPQQQLRFEKKYKRRIMLASRAPRWEKAVKFAQLATIAGALVWLLFYSEFEWWGQKYKPSEAMRQHATRLFGILDPDKRYERRKDGPQPPPPKEESGSESK